ncbi:hypothetical protein DM860_004275 [Cuscuta australis]|uniref:Uncharacterized protein n=1 Tax=Cuscuta australis TaxID=267555 RepID=A0A328E734_9ASTE|nr:hypothetical protein DM860_004275 [Cuscuta australis]
MFFGGLLGCRNFKLLFAILRLSPVTTGAEYESVRGRKTGQPYSLTQIERNGFSFSVWSIVPSPDDGNNYKREANCLQFQNVSKQFLAGRAPLGSVKIQLGYGKTVTAMVGYIKICALLTIVGPFTLDLSFGNNGDQGMKRSFSKSKQRE